MTAPLCVFYIAVTFLILISACAIRELLTVVHLTSHMFPRRVMATVAYNTHTGFDLKIRGVITKQHTKSHVHQR